MIGNKLQRFIILLLAWTMICCTTFSVAIQRLMTTDVVVQYVSEKMRQIPLDAIYWVDGEAHLYEIVENNAWEGGMVIHEVSPQEYMMESDCVQITGSRYMKCIIDASKEFESGGRARVITKLEQPNDQKNLAQLKTSSLKILLIVIMMILQIILIAILVLKHKKHQRWKMGCLLAGSIGIMIYLVVTMDIPAAVLPKSNFFDISHYIQLLFACWIGCSVHQQRKRTHCQLHMVAL